MQKKLEDELRRIREKLGLDCDLRVSWLPNCSRGLSGEVKSRNIRIYEETEGKALDTLRHEFIDFYISQTITPYREITNRLINMINEEAYRRKERVVEALKKLLV